MKTTSIKTTDPLILFPRHSYPIDWTKEFSRKAPINLEIGFGTAEHLIRQAQEHKKENFIGLELEGSLIKKALKRIHQNRMTNIRLIKIDARIALEWLFDQRSVQSMDCLFPFPWPKKRHHKKRLFNHEFLCLANSRLIKNGRLKIVTDYEPYFDWIQGQTKRSGFRVKTEKVSGQFDTKFERKWLSEGQKCFFQIELHKVKQVNKKIPKEKNIKPVKINSFDPQKFKPKSKTGTLTIVFKKFCYDARTRKGIQHVLIAEGHLVQRLTITIEPCGQRWRLFLDEGQKIFKTKGVLESFKMMQKALKH